MPHAITLSPIGPFDATGERAVRVPGSKSLTNRALLLAALAEGRSTIRRALWADDTRRMLEALAALGFVVDADDPDAIAIEGAGGAIPARHADLMLGNAGTAVRTLTAACCLGEGVYTIDGVPRMRQRPIGELVDALRLLDATIDYTMEDGCPPLRITAHRLRGGELTMKPTLSIQFITALLQVAPCTDHGIRLSFDGPVTSEPYAVMTLRLMANFGAEVEYNQPLTEAWVPAGGYTAVDYTVEPDASSATYFLAAAAAIPGSRVTLLDLPADSLQGDAAFADYLQQMGADVQRDDDAITVASTGKLHGIDADLNHIPDAAMTIAALAALAEGPTTIRNVGNWRVKETDRMAAMQRELSRLGCTVTVNGDDITIAPPPNGRITPAAVDTYDDHRMAMALSVIGLAQPGVTINDPACVNKTYPGFFDDLAALETRGQGAKGPRGRGSQTGSGSSANTSWNDESQSSSAPTHLAPRPLGPSAPSPAGGAP